MNKPRIVITDNGKPIIAIYSHQNTDSSTLVCLLRSAVEKIGFDEDIPTGQAIIIPFFRPRSEPAILDPQYP